MKRNYDLSESTMKIFSKNVRLFFKYAQKLAQDRPEYKTDPDTFIYQTDLGKDFIADLYDFISADLEDLDIEELRKDKEYLEMQVKAEMAKIWWDNNAYYEARLLRDNQFKKAMGSIKNVQKILALH
ncbi:MAG: hypothetical protein U5N56_05180 [Candidatus Marinimicrobia bacterium]|nr:hypothetical protein [Candidatus Neomarinimicrobiota bacterium]